MIDKILIGDSLEIIKKIPDNFVHAIISDIPYGISYEDWDILHNNTNTALGGTSTAQIEAGAIFKRRGKPLNGWCNADKKIPVEYQEWCMKWGRDWLRVLKPGASCLIFAGRRFAHRCITALEDCGFTFKDMLAWEKSIAPHRAQRISEIYKRRGNEHASEKWSGWRVANLKPLFEPILWFQKPYKTGGTLADNILKYDVGAWNEEALIVYNKNYSTQGESTFSNILNIPGDKCDHGLHETQKPLKLMECLIALVTTRDAIILDPFAGSGTTCVAAKNICRHYIGIEINEKYVKIADKRLAQPIQKQLGFDSHFQRKNESIQCVLGNFSG
jgi:site-specific DNA-methyltransferase (adenine-specific)